MGVKISALPQNELPYSGSEQFPLVQNDNLLGETRAGTLSSLVNYLSGDFAFYNRTNEFTQSQSVSGDLTVTGTISATVFNAVSANFTVIDIKQYELSGFNVTGDVSITGNLSATGDTTFEGNLNISGDVSTIGNLSATGDIKTNSIIYDVSGTSVDWNNAYTATASTSANWDSVYSSVASTSANWDYAYSSTASTSANWDSVYSSVASTSANWDSVYASTLATSANWDSVYSSVASASANWDSVYTSTLATSANWDSVYTSILATSANWNNAYSSTASTSANWDSVYSSVQLLSATWEESAEVLPTVTNYLSTNNILLDGITATNTISSNNIIYDAQGNSVNWNNTYSSTASTSANWNSVHATVQSLSATWESGGTASPVISGLILPTGITQLGADIDGEAASDNSGWSVSMNDAGDRVAIGAIKDYGLESSVGYTRIYEWNGTAWTQLGVDIEGAPYDDNATGYSVSLNAIGDRVAIGDPTYNTYTGYARVYEWDGTAWMQLGADIDSEAASDYSGHSVSMNDAGDRVAIGAIGNDGSGAYAGHVRVYDWDGTNWTQLGSDIDGEAAFDQSGHSVSMNAVGDRVAIGSFLNDGNGISSGHVRVYSWNGSTWTQLGSDIDGEATGDISGYSVSMNAAGDRVAIGAIGNDDGGVDAGHVRVYSWNGSAWTQLGSDIDGEAAGDYSGVSVSMNDAGDRVAIGATLNNGNGADAGHVRIYEWDGTAWTQFSQDIDGETAGDYSGYSVSMNAAGDRVAIGATGNDGGGVDAGHVRVYAVQDFEYTFPTVSGIVPIVPVYADLTAANAALDSGDFYWDASLNKLRVATS